MFNLLKIIKGMFTPYVEPNKPERIEPTIKDPAQTDCEFLEFAEACVKQEMNKQERKENEQKGLRS